MSLISPADSLPSINRVMSFNTSSITPSEENQFSRVEHNRDEKRGLNTLERRAKEERTEIQRNLKKLSGYSRTTSDLEEEEEEKETDNFGETASSEKYSDNINSELSHPSEIFSDVDILDYDVDVLFKNGNRYIGRISSYLMEGEAIFCWKDGTKYEGTFCDGIAQGLGNIKWPNGSWYDGELKYNRKHGRGISLLKKHNIPKMCYFGNWRKGEPNGKGMVIYGENNWYDGYWKKGRQHGFGLRNYPSGSTYLGKWKQGKEHGWGTMIWSNADVYTGSWRKGKMHGKGTYAWRCVSTNCFVRPMQNTYMGHWKNGKRHGHGSLVIANGAVIHGIWVNGVKQGPGQIICRNGLLIESSYLFKDDAIYKFDNPIMIPFWNKWYCEFLSSYRTGIFYVQPILMAKEVAPQTESERQNNIPMFESDESLALRDIDLEGVFQQVPNCFDDEAEQQISENTSKQYKEKKKQTAEKVTEETAAECNASPNNIPAFAPVESLPLWDIVMKGVCQPVLNCFEEIDYMIRPEDVKLLNYEEMCLRKVVTNRMPDINHIYQHYATIACDKKPSFKAFMFKIMLWQMCRDCAIDETDFSLCQLDNLAGYDSYPFDIVLPFQMIQYLLLLAFELCVKKRKANSTIPGKWGGAFDYFLNNYALPGMEKLNQMKELCNRIPLQSIFLFFEEMGEPVTISKIVNYITGSELTDNKVKRKPKFKISSKLNGCNKIYPDGRIVYEQSNGTLLETIFESEHGHEKYFDVRDIKILGDMDLVHLLLQICPKANKTVFVHDYQVSFLEFCDFINLAIKKYDALLDLSKDVLEVTRQANCDTCDSWMDIEEYIEVVSNEDKNKTASNSPYSSEDTVVKCEKRNENLRNKFSPSTDQGNNCIEFLSKDEITDNSENNVFEVVKNPGEEDSFINTGLPFKDARTITLRACDSDCQCFCHEKGGRTVSENISERESIDSMVSMSDLCDKTSEEEEKSEYSRDSEYDKSIDSLDSGSEEGDSTSEENSILTRENCVAHTSKKLFSDIDRIKNQVELNCIEKSKKIFDKLISFHFPKFKIKYYNIFKHINTEGMTPKEIKKILRLKDPDNSCLDKEIEDIDKELVEESLKVIKTVTKQRMYEKILIKNFKNTMSEVESGEYWEHFGSQNCTCIYNVCGPSCCKVNKKIVVRVENDEYEIATESSITIQ